MTKANFPGVIKVEEWGLDEFGRTWMAMEFVDGLIPSAVIGPGDCWSVHRLLERRGAQPRRPARARGGAPRPQARERAAALGGRRLGADHHRPRDRQVAGPGDGDRVGLGVRHAALHEPGAVPRHQERRAGDRPLRDGDHRVRAAGRAPALRGPHDPRAAAPAPRVAGARAADPAAVAGRGDARRGRQDDGAVHATPNLDLFMRKAMAKEPRLRFGSAAEMADEFERAARTDGLFEPADPADLAPLFPPASHPIAEIILDGEPRQRFDLRHGPLVLGRHEACQVVLNSPRLSRLHACVYLHRGRIWAADLHSQNGTMFQGRALAGGRADAVRGRRADLGVHALQPQRGRAAVPGLSERSAGLVELRAGPAARPVAVRSGAAVAGRGAARACGHRADADAWGRSTGARAGLAGSQACAVCHPAQHASWRASYHRTMTQPAAGRRAGAVRRRVDRPHRLSRDDDPQRRRGPHVTVCCRSTARAARSGPALLDVDVSLTVGSHRYQQYVARIDRGGGRARSGGCRSRGTSRAARWIPMNAAFLEPEGQRTATPETTCGT
jgi:hypothetical protein